MSVLRALAHDFQTLFPATDKGRERFRWLLLTLQAILVPIMASRTSNLLRAIEILAHCRVALLHLPGLGVAALDADVGGTPEGHSQPAV